MLSAYDCVWRWIAEKRWLKRNSDGALPIDWIQNGAYILITPWMATMPCISFNIYFVNSFLFFASHCLSLLFLLDVSTSFLNCFRYCARISRKGMHLSQSLLTHKNKRLLPLSHLQAQTNTLASHCKNYLFTSFLFTFYQSITFFRMEFYGLFAFCCLLVLLFI